MLGLLSLLAVVLPAPADLPAGWSKPSRVIVEQQWRKRDVRRHFLSMSADLDQDGVPDRAEVLVNAAEQNFGVFVWLHSQPEPIKVWQWKLKDLRSFGIALASKGIFRTACGKGYDPPACQQGAPASVKVNSPMLSLFFDESSDYLAVWNARDRSFHVVQMSD